MEIIKLLSFSLSLVLLLGIVQSFDYNEKELQTEEGLEAMYDRWRHHHKVTEKSPERFNAFKKTVHLVHDHNTQNKPYTLQVGHLAAMLDGDFGTNHTERPALHAASKCPNAPEAPIPPRLDWREKNAVTPVRKHAGNGFKPSTYAGIGAIEGINAIRTGQLLELSEQFIADCYYCPNWIELHELDQFVRDQGGMPTTQDYPFKNARGTCDKDKLNGKKVTIDGIVMGCAGSEEYMEKLVNQQPIIFTFDPANDFHHVKEGVYSNEACNDPGLRGTMLLLVGWDVAPDGTKYWIAKNCYGEEWGDKGYIKIKRTPKGLCNMYGFVAVVTKSLETRNTEL